MWNFSQARVAGSAGEQEESALAGVADRGDGQVLDRVELEVAAHCP